MSACKTDDETKCDKEGRREFSLLACGFFVKCEKCQHINVAVQCPELYVHAIAGGLSEVHCHVCGNRFEAAMGGAEWAAEVIAKLLRGPNKEVVKGSAPWPKKSEKEKEETIN